MSIGFIRYRVKCGKEYAAFCKADRRDGCKTNNEINLRRVIDKEKGIFRSRERGLFMFSIEQGYSDYILNLNHFRIMTVDEYMQSRNPQILLSNELSNWLYHQQVN